MRYLGEDEAMGYVGELYEDLDGQLYGWVEGVDEWGDPIGSWHGLSQPEVPALGGLGALYAAPDGTVYQVQGLADEEAAGGGQPGPRAQGPRRPPGRPGPGGRGGAPRKKKGGFFKKLLPIAKFAAGLIPGAGAVVRAGIDVAEKALTKPGVAGYDGLGALYAAPDGTVYQVQGLAAEDLDGLYADEELRGFAADEELRGFAADEELRGFAADEELRGFAADEELRGLDQDQELRGFAADEELRGLADEELRGLDQGYVREAAVNGLEAYVPVQPAKTRWFVRPSETPEIWKPLW